MGGKCKKAKVVKYRIRQSVKHISNLKQTKGNYVYHQTPKMHRNNIAFVAEYKG
jgi:hypothetical protein